MELKINSELKQQADCLVNGENDGNFKLRGNTKSIIINEHEILKHWNQDTALAGGNNNGDGSNIFLRPYGADLATNQAKLTPAGTLEVGALVTERDQNIKRTDVDASKANNNVSTTIYPTSVNIMDTASRIITRMESCVTPSGPIESYWYVRNYNTSGDMVAQKGIKMSMAKNGDLTYNVADAANFRNAIDVAQKGNYAFYKFPHPQPIDTDNSIDKSLTITTYGRPVFVSVCGDLNPLEESCWIQIQLYRDGTELSYMICESHSSSNNNPFCLNYLDTVAAGSHTYRLRIYIGGGSGTLTENGAHEAPNFMAYEI